MSELPEGGPERRAALTQQVADRTGIDEAMIERLVRGFYARVRGDDVLGPIFAAKIDDWEPHLQKMFAFWGACSDFGEPGWSLTFIGIDVSAITSLPLACE